MTLPSMKGTIMRLRQIGLRGYDPARASGIGHPIENVMVWLPPGWYVRLLLEAVSGPEFAALENVVGRSRELSFVPGHERYNYRLEEARVEIHDREYIAEYVRRGACYDPQITFGLGLTLFQNLVARLRG